MNMLLGYGYPGPVVATIVAAIIGVIASIVIFFVFMPENRKERFSSTFAAGLHAFLNFRAFWLSGLIKFFYLMLSLIILLTGIVQMFSNFRYFFQSLLVTVGGLVGLRLVFELAYVFMSIRDQTARIATVIERIDSRAGGVLPDASSPEGPACEESVLEVPVAAQVLPGHCLNCNAKVDSKAAFCTNCGAKIER